MDVLRGQENYKIVRFDKILEVPSTQNFVRFEMPENIAFVVQRIGADHDIDSFEISEKKVATNVLSSYAPIDDVDPYSALDWDLGDYFIVVKPKERVRIDAPAGTKIRLSGIGIWFDKEKISFEQIPEVAKLLPREQVQHTIRFWRVEYSTTLYDNSGGTAAMTVPAYDRKELGTLSAGDKEKYTIFKVYATVSSGYDDKIGVRLLYGSNLEDLYDARLVVPGVAGLDEANGIIVKALKPYKNNENAKLPVPIEVKDSQLKVEMMTTVSFDVPAGQTVTGTVILEGEYQSL